MTRTISLKELQSHFNVPPGDEIIIEDNGQLIAHISSLSIHSGPLEERPLGLLKGQMWVSPDFDAPDAELEDLFQNGPVFPDNTAPESSQ